MGHRVLRILIVKEYAFMVEYRNIERILEKKRFIGSFPLNEFKKRIFISINSCATSITKH